MLLKILIKKGVVMKSCTKAIIFLFVLISVSFSQKEFPMVDEKINFTEVVKLDPSNAAEDIYNSFKRWIASNTNNFSRTIESKSSQSREKWLGTRALSAEDEKLFKNDNPLKLDSKSELIVRVVSRYEGSSMACIRYLVIDYNIGILIKDGKYKYEITDFNYANYDLKTKKLKPIRALDENCKSSKGALESLLKCEKCSKGINKFSVSFIEDVNLLIGKIEAIKVSKTKKDDW